MDYVAENKGKFLPESGDEDKVWFVVYTKAKQEQVAFENLTRQGFETYCPSISISKRRNGRIISLIEAYFPRYIFVRFNLARDNWAPLRSTRGVSSLVKFGGVPQRVPESLITALKRNESSENLQIVALNTWQSGDRISIEQGPFAGYSCIFESERSADRVAVLLNIIGKPTRTILSKQDLQIPQCT